EQLVQLMDLRLRSVRKRAVELATLAAQMSAFTFADAERVCFEATKAMLLAGKKELTQDLLESELREQQPRIALAAARPCPERYSSRRPADVHPLLRLLPPRTLERRRRKPSFPPPPARAPAQHATGLRRGTDAVREHLRAAAERFPQLATDVPY